MSFEYIVNQPWVYLEDATTNPSSTKLNPRKAQKIAQFRGSLVVDSGLACKGALNPTLNLRKACAVTLIIGLNPNLEGSIMPFCVQLTIHRLKIDPEGPSY